MISRTLNRISGALKALRRHRKVLPTESHPKSHHPKKEPTVHKKALGPVAQYVIDELDEAKNREEAQSALFGNKADLVREGSWNEAASHFNSLHHLK